MFHKWKNFTKIVPEIAADPDDQDNPTAWYITEPEIVGHEIISPKRCHQWIDENVKPRWILFGDRQLKNANNNDFSNPRSQQKLSGHSRTGTELSNWCSDCQQWIPELQQRIKDKMNDNDNDNDKLTELDN